MKLHGVKHEWSFPIFGAKKYNCPLCNTKLEKIQTDATAHSQSEEGKNHDFSAPGGDGFMTGNIKFTKTALRCNKCGRIYTTEQIRHKKALV